MIVGALDIDYPAYIENEHEIYNMVRILTRQGAIKCSTCNFSVGMHGSYKRTVAFSESIVRKITIVQVRCKKCRKVHAVIPNFIFPNKQYILHLIKKALECKDLSDCPADESTIRRWRHNLMINR